MFASESSFGTLVKLIRLRTPRLDFGLSCHRRRSRESKRRRRKRFDGFTAMKFHVVMSWVTTSYNLVVGCSVFFSPED
jgi:hypothetical protein